MIMNDGIQFKALSNFGFYELIVPQEKTPAEFLFRSIMDFFIMALPGSAYITVQVQGINFTWVRAGPNAGPLFNENYLFETLRGLYKDGT
jgi:hypothetical protein